VGPYREGVLAVRVRRPPAEGEANRAALRLVASALRVPPSALLLLAGERGRIKLLSIDGLTTAELDARLAGLGD